MKHQIPRLRIFAGPNGSGKSTIKDVISKELLGIYINPDEIEKAIKDKNYLDLKTYQIKTNLKEIIDFFKTSSFAQKVNLLENIHLITFSDNRMGFHNLMVNSYHASIISDFIRKKLLETKLSFTFETVMSSPDKIELLKTAQKYGYRTYLYYIATDDPIINISRVKNRVKQGGHPVPEEKIVSRYYRSLSLLLDAVKATNRAYIFDNSSNKHIWLCEITEAKEIKLQVNKIPKWFKDAIIDKIN